MCGPSAPLSAPEVSGDPTGCPQVPLFSLLAGVVGGKHLTGAACANGEDKISSRCISLSCGCTEAANEVMIQDGIDQWCTLYLPPLVRVP